MLSFPLAPLAQVTTSLTDERIRLVITALLVVAVLLGASTIWYFVHTSPRRKMQVAARARAARSAMAPLDEDPTTRVVADRPGSSGVDPVVASTPTGSTVAAADDEDDEWTRLTGPDPKQATPRRSNG